MCRDIGQIRALPNSPVPCRYGQLGCLEALSGAAREITSRVLESLPQSEELLAVTFPGRPEESVLTSRLQWARSYANSSEP
jgi:hypothetical protein